MCERWLKNCSDRSGIGAIGAGSGRNRGNCSVSGRSFPPNRSGIGAFYLRLIVQLFGKKQEPGSGPPNRGCPGLCSLLREQLFGPEAAGQTVLAAESLRTIVRAGCLEGCTKKKSRKTKTCSFSFINHNITKDYHVAIYIVIVANVVKIKKINLAVDSTSNDCYIYTILNKQKDKANEVY